MTLSFASLKITIRALIMVLILTSSFGFASFMAANSAQAIGAPVIDATNVSNNWAIRAISWMADKAWDGIKWVAEKAWDKLNLAWEWARDNIQAFFLGLALKLAAAFLTKIVQQYVSKTKIDNYLYYADFLARQIYAVDYITDKYKGDKETEKVLLSLLAGGQELYGHIRPGSTVFQGVKNSTVLNPRCQTDNIVSSDPQYYVRLAESQSLECIPALSFALAQDAAFGSLNSAQQAASAEINNSQGFQSVRACGDVTTSKNPGEEDGDKPTVDLNITTNTLNLVCSAITQPGSYTASMIDKMVGAIIDNSTKPSETNNGTQIANYLSTVTATAITKLLAGDDNSVIRFDGSDPRLESVKINQNFDFSSQIPKSLNADNVANGDVNFGNDSAGGKSAQNVTEFWHDICTDRLPLVTILKNNFGKADFPVKFNEINPGRLRNGILSFSSTNNDFDKMYYFLGNTRASGTWTYDKFKATIPNMTIEQLFSTKMPFADKDDDNDRWVYYNYVWQVLDAVGKYDPKLQRAGDRPQSELYSLGRRYALAINGYPKAKDLEDVANWSPSNWPYFVDSDGKGYQFSPGEQTIIVDAPSPTDGIDPGEEPDRLIGGNRGTETFVINDIYADMRVDNGDANGGGKVYSVDRNATTTALSGNARVYEIDGELIVMWPNSMDGRKMWKLKEDVAVNISDNGTITNPNSLRVGADQVTAVVEYTDKETGQIKVLAAESLEIQNPCANQPYGPPINIKDIENKVKLSQALSIDLWNWILQKNFVENSQGAGLSDY